MFYVAKVLVRTTKDCPAQWEGRTDDGRGIYIRYRYGWLQVYVASKPGASVFADDAHLLLEKQVGDSMDGSMTYPVLRSNVAGVLRLPTENGGFRDDDLRNYGLIPDNTLHEVNAWIDSARPCGHFVSAVLRNDLREAVERADMLCLRAIPAIVAYLVNVAPVGCWGSPEAVRTWRDVH